MSHAMQWYQMSDTGLVAWDKSASDTAPNLRALAYGDGFFTTMGVYDGSLLWQSYHQARLRSHCHALNLSLPTPTSEALWQALQACAANITHGLIKIIISRPTQSVRGYAYSASTEHNEALIWVGIMPSDILAQQQARFLDLPLGIKAPSAHLSSSLGQVILQQPATIATCLQSRLASFPAPLAGLKSLNRLDGVMIAGELQRMKQQHPKLTEALVADMAGNWVEGVMSNVFYQLTSDDDHIKHQWFTPPIEASGVRGTMRQVIIDRLAALGQPVVLRALQDADLLSLEALFFCNAVRGVMPVEALIVGGQRLELSLSVFNSNSVCT